ncbi:MAG: TolB family protein [Gemmatimonadaceae bacterium]
MFLVKADQTLTIAPFDPNTLALTGPEVRLLSELGGNEATSGAAVALSPSGTIAFLARTHKENQLVEVARSGAERVLTVNPDGYKDPRWSPDGTRVAFTLTDGEVSGALFVHNLRTGTRTRLSAGTQDLYPLWSPNGREIFHATVRDEAMRVARTGVDGTGDQRDLTDATGPVLGHPQAISPDGRTLLHRLNGSSTGYDIFAVPVVGSGASRPILATAADELSPDFSADQRWLAFTSTESGRTEVYVTAWPGLGARRQISSGGGEEPRWNPRGGELFYRTGNAMVAVRLEEREGLPFAVRRDTLFQAPYRRNARWQQYDVSADGQRFLMVREGARKNLWW